MIFKDLDKDKFLKICPRSLGDEMMIKDMIKWINK